MTELTLVQKGAIFPPFASAFELKKHIFLCIEDNDSRNVLKVDTYIKYNYGNRHRNHSYQ